MQKLKVNPPSPWRNIRSYTQYGLAGAVAGIAYWWPTLQRISELELPPNAPQWARGGLMIVGAAMAAIHYIHDHN